MQRYFIEYNENNTNNDILIISGDDYYHITKVMRMKMKDQLIVCDEHQTWLCEINTINSSNVEVKKIQQLLENKQLSIEVTIAHGLVTKEKKETVIDNITELGAYAYLPVVMERSTVKINNEKIDQKHKRLLKIAKEASEQAHRNTIMKVLPQVSFKELLLQAKEYDLCLYAYEKSGMEDSFRQVLNKFKQTKLLILIGPEGGISENEVKLLNENHFYPVTLGPRILRTEVAPSYVLSCCSYEKELKG